MKPPHGEARGLARLAKSAASCTAAILFGSALCCTYSPKETVNWPPRSDPGSPAVGVKSPPPPTAPAARPGVSPELSSPRPTIDARYVGRNHALLIANQSYLHVAKLDTPLGDATALKHVLEQRYGFEVTLLFEATAAQIRKQLRQLREALTQNDNLLVFYAGHGAIDPDTKRGYWGPVDGDEDRLNWLPVDDVTNELRAMRTRGVMVVSDSCYAGALMRDIAMVPRPQGNIEARASRRMRMVFTAGGMEPVADSDGSSHSVFAGALLRALEDNDSFTTGYDLYLRVAKEVSERARYAQEPQYGPLRDAGDEGGDLIFAVREAIGP